jgi:hypothetical protein
MERVDRAAVQLNDVVETAVGLGPDVSAMTVYEACIAVSLQLQLFPARQ